MDFGTAFLPRLLNRVVFGTPRAMSTGEIQTTIWQFADAARKIATAGFAGVELHGAHGYLLAQFLSSRSNVRTDAYGGEAHNRARIVVEIIRAIREVVPSGFCIGLKLNSVDVGSAAAMTERLEQFQVITEENIDFLEISGGSFEDGDPTFSTEPTAEANVKHKGASTIAREAFFIEFAEATRARFPHVPLMVTGGFRSRRGMEAAIAAGAGGGLGSAIATHLSADLPNSHGIYTVRNASRPGAVLQDALQPQSSYEILSLDLARPSSVRQFAAALNKRIASLEIPRIRALVLNAEVLEFEGQTWTDDNLTQTFASSYLGHWLLSLLLLESMDRECGRVVIVGSSAYSPHVPMISRHFPGDKTIIGESTDAIAKGSWSTNVEDPSYHSGFRRCGAAKLCLAMMMIELQERLHGDPVPGKLTTVGVDPGSLPMSTGLVRNSNWFVRIILHKVIIATLARIMVPLRPSCNNSLRTPEKSARDVVGAALAEKWHFGGLYLHV
ncbi:NADH oxidase [Cytospora mali]|uniref:NADH oxidase n=1 Tax=Cytospora mali TaxID=578113 RepID=A0A194W4H1_CYTMA|nr:NADH oxidase [Valsa mali]